jgi:hypothetical protein
MIVNTFKAIVKTGRSPLGIPCHGRQQLRLVCSSLPNGNERKAHLPLTRGRAVAARSAGVPDVRSNRRLSHT